MNLEKEAKDFMAQKKTSLDREAVRYYVGVLVPPALELGGDVDIGELEKSVRWLIDFENKLVEGS